MKKLFLAFLLGTAPMLLSPVSVASRPFHRGRHRGERIGSGGRGLV